MPSSVLRHVLALVLLVSSFVPAAAQVLPDSTVMERWRLANGLEVRTRHIPGAVGIAVSTSFRAGRGTDPVGREGQAELLANLFFTAPTAEHAARSLASMAALRPLGWGIQVDSRLVVLTEIGSRAQLPGILHEIGSRMRGVTIEEPALKSSRAELRRQFAEGHFARLDLALHHRLRDLGEGITDEQVLARASGNGIEKLTARDARAQIDRVYVPANAALVLVGDLDGLEVRRMIESEFSGIPAGIAAAEAPERSLTASSRVTTFASISKPAGGLGIIAPALEDSLHPAFYLGMMIFGAWCNDHWGKPAVPLTSRFKYALLEEPEMVRFYPPVVAGSATARALMDEFNLRAELFAQVSIQMAQLDQFRTNASWLIGGPVPPAILRRASSEGGALGTLATSTAVRALWKGDAFWDVYVSRFLSTAIAPGMFYPLLIDPRHQVALVLDPTSSTRQ